MTRARSGDGRPPTRGRPGHSAADGEVVEVARPAEAGPLVRIAGFAAGIDASVQSKLLAAFLLGACLLLGMATLSQVILHRMSGNVRDLGGLHDKIDRSRQMEYLITAQSHFRAMALLTQDESNNDKIATSKSAFLSHLSALERANSGTHADLLTRIREADERFAVSSERVLALYRAGNGEAAMQLHLSEEHPISHELETALRELQRGALAEMDESVAQFDRDRRLLEAAVWLFSGASIGLALLLPLVLSRAFVRPVRLIDRALATLARGDFGQRVDVPNRDEFGTLARHLNAMSARLATLYGELRSLNADLGAKNVRLNVELAERRRAEQELARAAEALRGSEARFRSLIANASDVILIVGPDGTILYQSPAATHAWGYADDALCGRNLLDVVHPDDLMAGQTLLARAADGPTGEVETELRVGRPDGTWCELEVIAKDLSADPEIGGIVATFHDVTDHKAFECELRHVAFHDALTGLPNRALFMDRVEHALARAGRYGRSVAVLFLDLDNFKVVNDSLGHEAGDRLLVQVAERLRASVRSGDTAARLGGDEFTVLLEDLAGEDEALSLVERMVERLRLPVDVQGRQLFPSASVGLTLGVPGRDRPEDLLRNADLAMYRAKADGKNRCAVFEPSMNADAVERLELESDLHGAIERGEFALVYQPIMSLEDTRILELEALLRWEHPRRGVVSPAKFIPIAEETGLIVPLGRWVLEEACRRLRAWQLEFPLHPPLSICVNLSPRQFRDLGLVADVERVLRENGLDPACLELEITEGAVMIDRDAAVATLRALKELGVRLAIDDFGTGYSSLSYLKHLPVDTVKIDRSFVNGLGQDANDGAIVRGVIALAKTLHLTVTGEGIETPEQLGQLQSLGCDRGQGYYFARPLLPEALASLLANQVDDDTQAEGADQAA